jgi:hypothetical protein
MITLITFSRKKPKKVVMKQLLESDLLFTYTVTTIGLFEQILIVLHILCVRQNQSVPCTFFTVPAEILARFSVGTVTKLRRLLTFVPSSTGLLSCDAVKCYGGIPTFRRS